MASRIGVAREFVPGGVPCFLVQRCGTDGCASPFHGEARSEIEIVIGRFTALGRELAPGKAVRYELEVNTVDYAMKGGLLEAPYNGYCCHINGVTSLGGASCRCRDAADVRAVPERATAKGVASLA